MNWTWKDGTSKDRKSKHGVWKEKGIENMGIWLGVIEQKKLYSSHTFKIYKIEK